MMWTTIAAALLVEFLAVPAVAGPRKSGSVRSLDTAQIEKLTGLKGALDAKEQVFKISSPRKDLKLITRGVRVTPAMGLTSWAAFTPAGSETLVMGDMVLTEDQVNPVLSVALDNGLEVTALHNHFLWESPRVMFMHIGGTGDEGKLASAVGKVFEKIQQTSGASGPMTTSEIDPAKSTLDPKKLDSILATRGVFKDGVYKATVGRTARMRGHSLGSAMGVNTWATFAGSDKKAVVDGDFAMVESELQGVLKQLRRAGIDIVAIHQHMTGEEPRIMFLHYWGLGSTVDLAKGIRAALDVAKTK
jgi:Domain of Unknown Function (DUF1259)